MSSISEDADDAPLVNYDTSKGSSISSGMQEEYDELLKYAVVTPKWDPQVNREKPATLPFLRLHEPEGMPLTTIDELSGRTESTTRNNNADDDGRDSAMGSDEITTGRKTYRDLPTERKDVDDFYGGRRQQPASLDSHETEDLQSVATPPIFTSTVVKQRNESDALGDSDAARMNDQLKLWGSKFNNMILAELGQTKLRLSDEYRRLLHAKEQEHELQISKLQDEIENIKELLHTYETSLARKDSVISNLTRALQTSRERREMFRALAQWKFRLSDERRQTFTSHLAKRHRERALTMRAWQAWRSVVEGGWKDKVEKACQRKAQEVCMKLTDDYETKLASLNEALEDARSEVQRLHGERDCYEETMKKAFMRGVCALNLEAMTMFQSGEGPDKDEIQTLSAAVDALSCAASLPVGNQTPLQAFQPPTASRMQHAPNPQFYSQNTVEPTTVFTQTCRKLPMSATSNHRSEVTSHVSANALPLQQVPTKLSKKQRKAKTLNVKVTASTVPHAAQTRNPSFSTVPASVLVKRHHPNVQNLGSQQPLRHVTKYPNTPTKPIVGQE